MKALNLYIRQILKEQSDIQDLLLDVLATLRSAYMVYRNAHWQVSGDDYYGNHLLLQRIYGEAETHIDDWAEQMVGYYGQNSVELSGEQMESIKAMVDDIDKQADPMKRALHVAKEVKEKLEHAYTIMKKSKEMSLGWDDTIMSIAKDKDKHIFLLQQAIGSDVEMEVESINENFSQRVKVPIELLKDLSERGFDLNSIRSKISDFDPIRDGLHQMHFEVIIGWLKRRLQREEMLTPEQSASNMNVEDIAVANVMGGKDNPEIIKKAKMMNISHLIDDFKDLMPPLSEHWDQHLDQVLEPGEELPWDNEEPETTMSKNPMNPYDANDTLQKVKAGAHVNTYGSQRAGVRRGSGPAGGGRVPGGKRLSEDFLRKYIRGILSENKKQYQAMMADIADIEGFNSEVVNWARKTFKKQNAIVWYLGWYKLRMLSLAIIRGKTEYNNKFIKFLKKLTSEEVDQSSAHAKAGNIFNYLSQSLNKSIWEHFMSLGVPKIEDYDYGTKIPIKVQSDMSDLEIEWMEKFDRYIPLEEAANDQIVIDFGDGFAWFFLDRWFCSVESKAAGHCGNEAGTENERIFSLREKTINPNTGEEAWVPHLTFIYDLQNGKWGETKGRKNSKPSEDFHKYIVALFSKPFVEVEISNPEDRKIAVKYQDSNNGLEIEMDFPDDDEVDLREPDSSKLKLPLNGIVGGGYNPESNFHISELSEDLQQKLFDANPNMMTTFMKYKKFGLTHDVAVEIHKIFSEHELFDKDFQITKEGFVIHYKGTLSEFAASYGYQTIEYIIDILDGDRHHIDFNETMHEWDAKHIAQNVPHEIGRKFQEAIGMSFDDYIDAYWPHINDEIESLLYQSHSSAVESGYYSMYRSILDDWLNEYDIKIIANSVIIKIPDFEIGKALEYIEEHDDSPTYQYGEQFWLDEMEVKDPDPAHYSHLFEPDMRAALEHFVEYFDEDVLEQIREEIGDE